MLIQGKNFTMRVDEGRWRTIINDGREESVTFQRPLYVGGLPEEVKDGAFKKWHVRNKNSFIGDNLLLNRFM